MSRAPAGFQARALGALARANGRYWGSAIAPVHSELRRWEERAGAIPDPDLRALASDKLEHERFNTEVAATLATLVPRRWRQTAIEAIVSLQVMYDYLDGLGEQLAEDPLANGLQLFEALAAPFGSGGAEGPVDYFRLRSGGGDDGYLEALATACREAFGRLPRADLVAPVAARTASLCGEAQTRTHSISSLGADQLREWSAPLAEDAGMLWWEYVAGGTASVLTVHALIAAAGDDETTGPEIEELDRAYLYISAVSTLLDSLVDLPCDLADGGHSFVGYYPTAEARAEGVGRVVALAAGAAVGLRNGPHHYMTAAGVAGYYLSAANARRLEARRVKARAQSEVQPLVAPILGIFRLWRLAKRLSA